MDLARAPRRAARKTGSGYENGELYKKSNDNSGVFLKPKMAEIEARLAICPNAKIHCII
jgi:hypothetical protein